MDDTLLVVQKINFYVTDFDLLFLPGIGILVYEAAQLDILVFIFKSDIPGEQPQFAPADKKVVHLGSCVIKCFQLFSCDIL